MSRVTQRICPWGELFPVTFHIVCDNLSLSACVCVRKNDHIGLPHVWKAGCVHSYRPTRSLRSDAPSVTRTHTHTHERTFIQSITLTISVYFLLKNHTYTETECCHCRSIKASLQPTVGIWQQRERKPPLTMLWMCVCMCLIITFHYVFVL